MDQQLVDGFALAGAKFMRFAKWMALSAVLYAIASGVMFFGNHAISATIVGASSILSMFFAFRYRRLAQNYCAIGNKCA